MPTQLPNAEKEIQQAFADAWAADAAAAIGAASAPEVRWQGVAEDPLPPESAPWARVALLHNSGAQVAFGEDPGARRYRETGIVTVQVFTPLNATSDLRQAQALVQVAIAAFRGVETPGGVEFQNVTGTRVGPTGAWFQYNVTAEFNYDSLE